MGDVITEQTEATESPLLGCCGQHSSDCNSTPLHSPDDSDDGCRCFSCVCNGVGKPSDEVGDGNSAGPLANSGLEPRRPIVSDIANDTASVPINFVQLHQGRSARIEYQAFLL